MRVEPPSPARPARPRSPRRPTARRRSPATLVSRSGQRIDQRADRKDEREPIRTAPAVVAETSECSRRAAAPAGDTSSSVMSSSKSTSAGSVRSFSRSAGRVASTPSRQPTPAPPLNAKPRSCRCPPSPPPCRPTVAPYPAASGDPGQNRRRSSPWSSGAGPETTALACGATAPGCGTGPASPGYLDGRRNAAGRNACY